MSNNNIIPLILTSDCIQIHSDVYFNWTDNCAAGYFVQPLLPTRKKCPYLGSVEGRSFCATGLCNFNIQKVPHLSLIWINDLRFWHTEKKKSVREWGVNNHCDDDTHDASYRNSWKSHGWTASSWAWCKRQSLGHDGNHICIHSA